MMSTMTSSASEVEDLRLLIYRSFAESGVAPRTRDLTEVVGGPDRARAALHALARDRQLVLDPDGAIVLAHPFAGRSFGFSVMGADTLWWGGCAWDSFAIPHLLRQSAVLVATRCGGCFSPIAVEVERDRPPTSDIVAHFATPMAHVWDDVVRACSNQLLFCSTECIARWAQATHSPLGATLDASTLWQLAGDWYAGRLERDHVRREPGDAAAYFAGCGLSGPFWAIG